MKQISRIVWATLSMLVAYATER